MRKTSPAEIQKYEFFVDPNQLITRIEKLHIHCFCGKNEESETVAYL